MFLIIFFILVIVSGLSYTAGSELNYKRTQNDKLESGKDQEQASNDKGTGK